MKAFLFAIVLGVSFAYVAKADSTFNFAPLTVSE